MSKRAVALVLALCLATILPTAAPVQAESLRGSVVDETNRPIPGLAVYLARTGVRSYPSITDERGSFAFSSVPPVTDVYFLEIYWGDLLVYRKSLSVSGDVTLLPIILDP